MIYKLANMGEPAKRHLNSVSLAFPVWPNIECQLGSFLIFPGIQTSIAQKPYMYVIFRGIWTPCSHLWIRNDYLLSSYVAEISLFCAKLL